MRLLGEMDERALGIRWARDGHAAGRLRLRAPSWEPMRPSCKGEPWSGQRRHQAAAMGGACQKDSSVPILKLMWMLMRAI